MSELFFFNAFKTLLLSHKSTKSWSLFMVAPGYVLVLVLMILDLNLCGVRIKCSQTLNSIYSEY